MSDVMVDRRNFLKQSAFTAGAAVAMSLEERALLTQQHQTAAASPTPSFSDRFPHGKIGAISISRVICGGNLIGGYAHSRDLIYVSSLLKSYFTVEKILETLEKCEEVGINTVITHVTKNKSDIHTTDLLNRYWNERGGKIQWIAQCAPFDGRMEETIQYAIDSGCIGAFLMGGLGDRWTKDNRLDRIAKTIETIQRNGLIAGVAGHSLQVPMACEREGIDPDFYVKTFHHDRCWSSTSKENRMDFHVDVQHFDGHGKDHDTMWCIDPEETSAFMATVKKPWIAYKVLAAGAIHPREGFRYAFEQGADFILCGMFDFQVAENAIIARKILAEPLHRTREWFA